MLSMTDEEGLDTRLKTILADSDRLLDRLRVHEASPHRGPAQYSDRVPSAELSKRSRCRAVLVFYAVHSPVKRYNKKCIK